MKLKFTFLAAISMSLGLLTITPSFASEEKPIEKKDKEKKEATSKTYSSRNNNAVKIYPDAVKRVLHVVAKPNDGKEIDFFVFDLEGTLMQHHKMTDGDREKIAGLKRGKYVYHVFCGDEETAIGEFEVR